jgi:hypothetical protein
MGRFVPFEEIRIVDEILHHEISRASRVRFPECRRADSVVAAGALRSRMVEQRIGLFRSASTSTGWRPYAHFCADRSAGAVYTIRAVSEHHSIVLKPKLWTFDTTPPANILAFLSGLVRLKGCPLT